MMIKEMNKIEEQELEAVVGGNSWLTIKGAFKHLQVGDSVTYIRDCGGSFGEDEVTGTITKIYCPNNPDEINYEIVSLKDAYAYVYPDQIVVAHRWGTIRGPLISL